MKYNNILEEELKNKVGQDYFWKYDCSRIIGKVDFCVSIHQNSQSLLEQDSLLWAEAKKALRIFTNPLYNSFLQLGKYVLLTHFYHRLFLLLLMPRKLLFYHITIFAMFFTKTILTGM